MPYTDIANFADLVEWLASFPDQGAGDPCGVCQTGEPYVVFSHTALARSEDVEVIEREVARSMACRLDDYLRSRGGRIYWRIPFESEIRDDAAVVRFSEDGPDVDFLTDRKCFKDHNWKRVSAYCRVYRATQQTMQPREMQSAA